MYYTHTAFPSAAPVLFRVQIYKENRVPRSILYVVCCVCVCIALLLYATV